MRVVLITMANVCRSVPNWQASCSGPEIEDDRPQAPLPHGWDYWDDTCPLPPGCIFGPQYNGCINLSVPHCPQVPRRSYPVLGAWEWRESCERAKAATCLPSWARHLN